MRVDTLHDYAHKLRHVGMLQVAGDLDYLVAWIKSPEWTGGTHLEPHPAGKDTVDFNSNDCPIPYTPCYEMVECCTNKPFAVAYLQSAKSIIQELLSIYTDGIEQTAINAYLDYSDKVIALLKGEEI